MTITTTPAASTSSSSTAMNDKDWTDFLSPILTTTAQTFAPDFGIDPRIAGQTVSQVLDIFGIGKGKAFSPTIAQEQAKAQLKQMLTPHLDDPAFKVALQKWLAAAVEPVQAQKSGKSYQPSGNLGKGWFDDVVSTVGDAVQSVDWGKVTQIGMQVLPVALAAL
jgi:hypothetical protein